MPGTSGIHGRRLGRQGKAVGFTPIGRRLCCLICLRPIESPGLASSNFICAASRGLGDERVGIDPLHGRGIDAKSSRNLANAFSTTGGL